MDTSVTDAFLNVLPTVRRGSSKWISFNCPECGDTRGRGGFIVTDSGGWRYRCFNGGCDYNEHPTGWEPESGLGGRPKRLFRLFGGSLSDLPTDILFTSAAKFNKSGAIVTDAEDERATRYFETQSMPPNTVNLFEPGEAIKDERYVKVLEYAVSRGEEVLCRHPFMWSKSYPTCLLIPYMHYDKIVGFLARDIRPDAQVKMWQKCHSDYVFRQDTLDKDGRAAIITEGVYDAIAIDGLAARGGALTKKQQLLLNLSGRDIIVLPDMNPSGINLVNAAEENGWFVSTPKWDRHVSDTAQAALQYGLLYTIDTVVKNTHKNYIKAKIKCKTGL